MNISKEHIDIIVKSLKNNPEQWNSDEHLLFHRDTDASIWIANGPTYYRWYVRGVDYRSYPFWFLSPSKWKLHLAIKQFLNKSQNKLRKNKEREMFGHMQKTDIQLKKIKEATP